MTDREDENNRILMMVAIAATPILLALTVFAQQFMLSLHEVNFDKAPRDVVESEKVTDPGIAGFTLQTKAIAKEVFYLRHNDLFEEQPKPRKTRRGGRNRPPVQEEQQRVVYLIDEEAVLKELDSMAVTRTERLRAAIVAGEIAGKGAAIERLKKLDAEVNQSGELAADVHWLRKHYEEGEAALSTEARDALVDRHGWFGELALVCGKPPKDDERWSLVAGYDRIRLMLGVYGLTIIVVSILGVIVGVVGLVGLYNGTLTGDFDAPAVGGSVYLEAFCVFLLAFSLSVLLRIPFRGADTSGAIAGMALGEVMMWSLLGAAFWPLLRGVSWDSLKVDLGLHTGQGVATEMTVGLLAFMAERPVLYLLNIFIEMIKTLGSGDSEAPEVEGTGAFPMFESPIGNSWLLVWLGALGSVVWAPVVEELVLRGCLYRALTTWMRWPLAVLLSSICFAIIHPYSADGMASVFVGGVTFAILREWRGSLIACITAHALHNGSIELLNFGYVSLLSK